MTWMITRDTPTSLEKHRIVSPRPDDTQHCGGETSPQGLHHGGHRYETIIFGFTINNLWYVMVTNGFI